MTGEETTVIITLSLNRWVSGSSYSLFADQLQTAVAIEGNPQLHYTQQHVAEYHLRKHMFKNYLKACDDR
jgi:hypothetical protein